MFSLFSNQGISDIQGFLNRFESRRDVKVNNAWIVPASVSGGFSPFPTTYHLIVWYETGTPTEPLQEHSDYTGGE